MSRRHSSARRYTPEELRRFADERGVKVASPFGRPVLLDMRAVDEARRSDRAEKVLPLIQEAESVLRQPTHAPERALLLVHSLVPLLDKRVLPEKVWRRGWAVTSRIRGKYAAHVTG